MLQLFTVPSCTSCRKARAWLDKHHIKYVERNIMKEPLSAEELKMILSLTEEGTTDLISVRSRTYQELDIDWENITILQLLKVLEKNPGLLRRPMLLDAKRLQIGFNEAEIRCFLPREIRKMEMRNAQMMSGL